MIALGVTLVFQPPNWPLLLTGAAGTLILAEVVLFVAWVRRAQGPVPAVVMGFSLLAAPAGALLGRLYGMEVLGVLAVIVPALAAPLISAAASTRRDTRTMLTTGGWGVLLGAMASATLMWTPAGALAAIAAAGVCWALRAYARTTAPIGARVKQLLLALRIAMILLLGLWAMSPALEYRTLKDVPGLVIVALDTSKSMNWKDMPADYSQGHLQGDEKPVSRLSAAITALKDTQRTLDRIARHSDIELVLFDKALGTTTPLNDQALSKLPDNAQARGQATAIGDCLSAAREPHRRTGTEVTAVVLISDGINNTGRTSPMRYAEVLGSRQIPLFTVGAGADSSDAAVKNLSVSVSTGDRDEVQAFNRMVITVPIAASGLSGTTIRITCKFGTETVGTKTVTCREGQYSETLQFAHVPVRAGFQMLTVTAEPIGPPIPDLVGRTRATKLIHVVDREMRILYVEGRFRYEAKYITRALAAAQRFGLDRRVLLQPPGRDTPSALPETMDQWRAYHAIILGDVAPDQFTPKQLEMLKELVATYGKGLCMFGGSKSFGAGRWDATPLADVFGVDLAASRGQLDAKTLITPTPDAEEFPFMRIGPDGVDLQQAWAMLPPLPGANVLAGIKPAARVLAKSQTGQPMIVAQPYGKGRSLCIAFDTTWRWVLTPKDTAEYQQRFWRQVVEYLADPRGNLWITTERSTYDRQRLTDGLDVIKVTAGIEDARGRPIKDAPSDPPLEFLLAQPDNKRSTHALRQDGDVRRALLAGLSTEGQYVLTLARKVDGRDLTAEHRFRIVYRDVESERARADMDLLRQMAGASGGSYVPLAKIQDALQKISTDRKPQPVQAVKHLALSKDYVWPILIALMSLLCLEWALRKRKGLV